MGSKIFDIELIIESVKKHPCLYDKTSSEFKDTGLKKTIWTAIGLQYGLKGKSNFVFYSYKFPQKLQTTFLLMYFFFIPLPFYVLNSTKF